MLRSVLLQHQDQIITDKSDLAHYKFLYKSVGGLGIANMVLFPVILLAIPKIKKIGPNKLAALTMLQFTGFMALAKVGGMYDEHEKLIISRYLSHVRPEELTNVVKNNQPVDQLLRQNFEDWERVHKNVINQKNF